MASYLHRNGLNDIMRQHFIRRMRLRFHMQRWSGQIFYSQTSILKSRYITRCSRIWPLLGLRFHVHDLSYNDLSTSPSPRSFVRRKVGSNLHVSAVEPKVGVQRARAAILLPICQDVCVQVPGTVIGCVRDPVVARVVQNIVQEGVGVKYQGRDPVVLAGKVIAVLLKGLAPPPYHRAVRRWIGLFCVSRRSVQRRQVNKEEVLVARLKQRRHGQGKDAGDDRVKDAGEVVGPGGLCQVVDIIYSDPDCDESFRRRDLQFLFKHWLPISQELLSLVDQRDGEVMMKRRAASVSF